MAEACRGCSATALRNGAALAYAVLLLKGIIKLGKPSLLRSAVVCLFSLCTELDFWQVKLSELAPDGMERALMFTAGGAES